MRFGGCSFGFIVFYFWFLLLCFFVVVYLFVCLLSVGYCNDDDYEETRRGDVYIFIYVDPFRINTKYTNENYNREQQSTILYTNTKRVC